MELIILLALAKVFFGVLNQIINLGGFILKFHK